MSMSVSMGTSVIKFLSVEIKSVCLSNLSLIASSIERFYHQFRLSYSLFAPEKKERVGVEIVFKSFEYINF